MEAKKMNVNFESAKTLAGEGSILLLLSIIPYAGWILGIIGVVLLLRALKELSYYYQDETIYQNSLTGVKFYIIALISAGVAIAALLIGIGTATGFKYKTVHFTPTPGFAAGLIVFLGGLLIAFIFYLLATSHLRRTFDTLAQQSGEESFSTAGTLLRWGAILSIILVGFILLLVAWIFATIGFFTMKSRQYQQYTPQPNEYLPPPPPPQNTIQTTNATARKGGI
jgi:uncharacterized membrane protein